MIFPALMVAACFLVRYSDARYCHKCTASSHYQDVDCHEGYCEGDVCWLQLATHNGTYHLTKFCADKRSFARVETNGIDNCVLKHRTMVCVCDGDDWCTSPQYLRQLDSYMDFTNNGLGPLSSPLHRRLQRRRRWLRRRKALV